MVWSSKGIIDQRFEVDLHGPNNYKHLEKIAFEILDNIDSFLIKQKNYKTIASFLKLAFQKNNYKELDLDKDSSILRDLFSKHEPSKKNQTELISRSSLFIKNTLSDLNRIDRDLLGIKSYKENNPKLIFDIPVSDIPNLIQMKLNEKGWIIDTEDKSQRFDFNFKANIEKSNMAYSSRAFDDLFIAVENKSYSTSLSSDNLIFDVQNKFKNQKIDSEKIYEGMYVYNGIWYESHIYNSRVFLKSITDIPTANIIQKYYKHFLDYRMLVSSIFGSHKLEVKSKISDKLSNLKSDSTNFKDKQEKMTEESNLLSIKQRNTFEATNKF